MILHRGEDVFISPVNGGSFRCLEVRDKSIIWGFRDNICHEIDCLEFFFSEVGEEIKTHLVGFFRVSVVFFDGEVVFNKDRLSVEIFFRVSSSDTVLTFPLLVSSDGSGFVVLGGGR